MKPHEIVELAALLASRGPAVVESPAPDVRDALLHAWKVIRRSTSDWTTELRSAATADALGDVAVDVFTVDPLVRVWAVLLEARAVRTGSPDLASVSLNVITGLNRSRSLAMQWLLDEADRVDETARSVDRFRRRVERWTDALLGPLTRRYGIEGRAFDEERAADFGADGCGRGLLAGRPTVFDLCLAGIRASRDDAPFPLRDSPCAAAVASAILAWVPRDLFAEDGGLRAVDRLRIRRDAGDRRPRPVATKWRRDHGRAARPAAPHEDFGTRR